MKPLTRNELGFEHAPIPRLTGRERPEWESASFRDDVVHGLSLPRKSVPPKYFYDATGAALFDRICDLPEYYLTRAELEILSARAEEIAGILGPGATLVELGSGSSLKTRLLLDRLREPHAYVPLDICADALASATARLRKAYPGLLVLPTRADYTHGIALPPAAARGGKLAVFFPGSTIGNLEPHEAVPLLRKIRRRLGPGGWLIVGVDVKKPAALLEPAYNDAAGLTARFNRNLLVRVRDELDAEVDPDGFAHRAFYNEAAGRIEMHLCSCRDQALRIGDRAFRFHSGETLHTENSYKYAPQEFQRLAAEAGFAAARVWQDGDGRFSVHALQA
jgi:L-histidine Nalpha-methyltransferase